MAAILISDDEIPGLEAEASRRGARDLARPEADERLIALVASVRSRHMVQAKPLFLEVFR